MEIAFMHTFLGICPSFSFYCIFGVRLGVVPQMDIFLYGENIQRYQKLKALKMNECKSLWKLLKQKKRR